MSEVKERPILFSGPMVRAILAGQKTQTRRIVKFPKWMQDSEGGQAPEIPKQFDGYVDMVPITAGHVWSFCSCPYGGPNDRLWVRETWRTGKSLDGHSPKQIEEAASEFGFTGGDGYISAPIWYVADGSRRKFADNDDKYFQGPGKTRVSIHMPRWASRITLEITGVRVERLNEISEEYALAEGVEPTLMNDARTRFVNLWTSINGDGSWDANPFVWVIEFKRVDL